MKERIGKYYNVISGYAFKSSDLKDSADIPIIKIGNISNGRNVIFENMQYVDLEFLTIDEKYHIKYGDVLISLTGSHINQPNSMVGRVCRNYDKQTYLLNQRAGKIFAKENASTDYIFYALLTKAMKESIVSRAYGAANQVNVSPSAIMSIKWDFPSLPIQQKIASILSAYDRLIENNTRRIRLLEQMAENLYKEWFVRFRFPGHENVEMVNGLPKGWEFKRVSNVCETIGGGTPSTTNSAYWGGDIKWVTPSDITSKKSLALLKIAGRITEEGLKKSSAKLLPPYTILMTSRASIGFFGICPDNVCTNQGFISIIPNKDNVRMYLLYTFKARKEEIISNANGSTFLEISKGRFRKMKVLVPSEDILNMFEKKTMLSFREVLHLEMQNTLLTRQRDLLLPRLMSGKLEVKS